MLIVIHEPEDQGVGFYVHYLERYFRVLAVATTVEDANLYVQQNPEAALLVSLGPLCMMANKNDRGVPLDPKRKVH